MLPQRQQKITYVSESRLTLSARRMWIRHCRKLRFLLLLLFVLILGASGAVTRAQETCPNIGNAEGESISGQIKVDSSGERVGRRLRTEVYATAR